MLEEHDGAGQRAFVNAKAARQLKSEFPLDALVAKRFAFAGLSWNGQRLAANAADRRGGPLKRRQACFAERYPVGVRQQRIAKQAASREHHAGQITREALEPTSQRKPQ